MWSNRSQVVARPANRPPAHSTIQPSGHPPGNPTVDAIRRPPHSSARPTWVRLEGHLYIADPQGVGGLGPASEVDLALNWAGDGLPTFGCKQTTGIVQRGGAEL